jgi:DNA invertase Pin-like site-specific DNA recombinase
MESGADFRAADFPEANRLMIHILSAIAEYEAKLISERTKAGLQSRRLRGFKLGTPATLVPGRSPAPRLNRERARVESARMRPIINHLRREGFTDLSALTSVLNDRGYTTARGRQWYPITVRRLLRRLAEKQNEGHL